MLKYSQCLGQNFAYNEMSFFLVSMLQRFRAFELAPGAQPEGSLPPPRWKQGLGRQASEKIWPANAVTAFIKVRPCFTMCLIGC